VRLSFVDGRPLLSWTWLLAGACNEPLHPEIAMDDKTTARPAAMVTVLFIGIPVKCYVRDSRLSHVPCRLIDDRQSLLVPEG
jgi:hypothetical protein